MLGGGRVLVLPLQVYNATSEINWPVAAVGGMALLIISMIAVAGIQPAPQIQRGAVMAAVASHRMPPGATSRSAPSRSRRRFSSSRRSPSWCSTRSTRSPTTVFPPQGFSTRWYVNLFAQDVFYAAAWRSIVLATLSTAIALVIGTMAAYALVRYRLPAADLIKAFLLSPIVLPKIVLGVALFMFFVRVRTLDNYSSLLVTHVLVILPFVIAMVSAALANFDWTCRRPRWISAPARSRRSSASSCRRFRSAWRSPACSPSSRRSIRSRPRSSWCAPGSNTLPVEMFLYLQKWQDPTIAALSSLLILFAIVLVG